MTDLTRPDIETAYAAALARDAAKVRARFSKAYDKKAAPQEAPCRWCGVTVHNSYAERPTCADCKDAPDLKARLAAAREKAAVENERSQKRRVLFASVWDGHV